jgi:hypothetical protein
MRLSAIVGYCLVAVCLSACASGSADWSGSPAAGPSATRGGDQIHLAAVASRITGVLGDVCRCRATAEENIGAPDLCGYPLQVEQLTELYASTNGQRVKITSGMLGFFESDDELAFVLAHELSHILLGHAGAFSGPSTRSAEVEADRLGIRIVAAAKFDPEIAAQFPERLARSYPAVDRQAGTYPTSANRTSMIRSALRTGSGSLAGLGLQANCAD